MHSDYWHQRWQDNQIGFDRQTANPHLRLHWESIAPDGTETVFAPLCGKSVDLAWLAGRGHQVIGVELSEIACRRFFFERGVEPVISRAGPFIRFQHENMVILCGDYFDLQAQHLQGARLFYDRAALIALPPEVRPNYLDRLGKLLGPGGSGLLITLDYPEQAFTGPPFAVRDVEVDATLGRLYRLKRLSREALGPDDPLIKRGLTGASESVFSINPGQGRD